MGLRELKREQLLRDIVDTTCRLIEEHGYEETRVEEVCRRLRISKPTFYRYFASKDAVLNEVRLRMTESWTEQVNALRQSLPPEQAVARLQQLARFAADDLLQRQTVSRAVYLHATASTDRIRSAEVQAEDSLAQLLDEAQESGQLDRSRSPALLGLVLDSVFTATGYAWALGTIDSDHLEQALLAGLEVCLFGMLDAEHAARKQAALQEGRLSEPTSPATVRRAS